MKKYFLTLISSFLIVNFSNAQILLSESFEGTFPPAGWLIQNNGTGNNWTPLNDANYASAGSKSMIYAYHGTNAANTWAYMPAIALNSGDVLLITFDQRVRGVGYTEKLKVTVGNAQTVASQTTTLFNNATLNNITYTQHTINFTAPSTGNFYFAFNCYSAANQYNLYIDNLVIKKLGADVSVKTLTAPGSGCSLTNAENVIITIKNEGLTSVSGFPVYYSVNGSGLVTESVSASIAPSATMDYTFSNTANLSANGNYIIKAYADLSSDVDHFNDTISKIIENPINGLLTKSYTTTTTIPDKDTAGINAPIYFCGLPTALNGTSLKIESLTIDSLMHTYTGDLDIYLISPNNDSIAVCVNNGGSGDNILHAVFTQSATTNVSTLTSGGIPAGTYHPISTAGFTTFYNGQNPNGAWKLYVADFKATDFGKLHKWTLAFDIVTEVAAQNNNDNLLLVYPNPTSGNLNIDYFGEGEMLNVQILNSTGQEIYKENVSRFSGNYSKVIDLKKHAKGIYFMRVSNGSNISNRKIVVE